MEQWIIEAVGGGLAGQIARGVWMAICLLGCALIMSTWTYRTGDRATELIVGGRFPFRDGRDEQRMLIQAVLRAAGTAALVVWGFTVYPVTEWWINAETAAIGACLAALPLRRYWSVAGTVITHMRANPAYRQMITDQIGAHLADKAAEETQRRTDQRDQQRRARQHRAQRRAVKAARRRNRR
ncbi:hypothetical protein MA5S0422_3014 [Mycobacteroides abscessus 5S-0422]|uniref:Transmembrane protein n=1 Tax=Mycobacteroides abscessus subsp. bolletii 1513 TaxID=1299321 RepID=X8DT73_9MYCO|nr:hypothetical protein [Mycobacteroides abscessus]EUA71594.1 hypothetical protein I540_3248 [Mycobacteroides abscessus subsp. bolletii 1513]EIU10007.1 hypothetical protein MA5S0304_2081 [Mycobacteroides abscessus 5S-0304]EIU13339.1 hypothetical protein MA5S0422_3014 [Mycobacteroides abscessus 5S-0422]EIU20094.1 hypothetical protein MA5S0708_5103 [Mycobacteroides abscessus 5S-0708]EIU26704.1 hypothetical protein MA5S0817_1627 [Mycobacteroides abscessus 5S-0817]